MLSSSVAADLTDTRIVDLLTSQQPSCEVIVHAAACLDQSLYAPAISLTNGVGMQQMLDLAARWGVASFVYLSSVPVIGRPVQLPVTECHPTDPPTAYHASKLYGEQLLELARREGTPGVTLRLTAPIGPGTPAHRIVAVFVRRALAGEPLELAGTGSRGQDYVDVRDVAAAVEKVLAPPPTGLLNIAAGTCTTNHELAHCCVDALASSSEVRLSGSPDPDDDVRWEVSIAKAEKLIDYRPRCSLAQSITAMAEELQER